LFGNKCEGSLLGTAMLTAERCRVRAAECQRMAAQAPNARVRDILIDMARTWMRLALEASNGRWRETGALGMYGRGSRGPTRHVCSICSVVRTRDRVAGAGYACNARPDLHTVCRSFPKISSALSAKVCGGSRSAKILIQVPNDPACLQHMQCGPHARSSCRRWLRLQRSPRSPHRLPLIS
jgi:hypothetical protein